MPTDPSAAMIQSSGSYIFHLAFAIIILVWVKPTYNFRCYKQVGIDFDCENPVGFDPETMTDCKYANWLGADNPASWVQSWPDPANDWATDPNESFVNTTC